MFTRDDGAQERRLDREGTDLMWRSSQRRLCAGPITHLGTVQYKPGGRPYKKAQATASSDGFESLRYTSRSEPVVEARLEPVIAYRKRFRNQVRPEAPPATTPNAMRSTQA